jgi:hypothetical protein
LIKFIQIISFISILFVCILSIYNNITPSDIICNVGDINNEIGTKINNNMNLQGHVHVNDKEAGKTIATQVGITGAMVGGALGVGKAIAKSPMPPLQKATAVVVSSVVTGAAQAGISVFNNTLSKNVNPSSIVNSKSGTVSTNINDITSKFVSDSQSSPLHDIFYSLEIIDYACLTILYILIIQLVYKLFLKDNINLRLFKVLGDNFNNKIEFYLNKIIKLNKQMSIF